jgi:hypothetical protein
MKELELTWNRTLRIRLPIIALLVTIAGVSHAAAPVDYGRGLIPYKAVGKWQVQYDPSLRGCAIFSSFDNGTSVRFGFNSVCGDGRYPAYITLLNDKWTQQFKLNERYSLEVGFDDRPSRQYWFWTQKEMRKQIMITLLPDDTLLSEVAGSTTATIGYGKKLTSVDLGKTIPQAIDSMRACQKAHVPSS